jgi:glycosyltransferase involved in cell wall biosynthesis
LVPNGNIQKLADKIMFLMENNNIRIEMGKTAKENAKRFLPEQIVSQWDRLFKQILSEK